MKNPQARSSKPLILGLALAFLASWAAVYLLAANREALLRRYTELVRRNDELQGELEAAGERLRASQANSDAAELQESDTAREDLRRAERRTDAVRVQAAEIAVNSAHLARAEELLERIPERRRGFAWHLLHARAERRFPVLVDSDDDVLTLSAAPDRGEVMVGTRGGWLTGYLLPSEERALAGSAGGVRTRFRIAAHEEALFACAYAPDGRRVASGDLAGRVSVWALPGADELARLDFDETVTALAFLDAEHLAIGGDDGRLAVWDFIEGSLLELHGHERTINAIDVDRAHGRFATAGDDSLVRIWSGARFERMVELAGHADWISDVAFAPGGDVVSSASSDLTIRHWNPDDGVLIAATSTAGVEIVGLDYGKDAGTWCAYGRRGELLFERAGARMQYDVPLIDGIALLDGTSAADLSWLALAMGGVLSYWPAEPGSFHGRRTADAGEMRSLASSADGRLVVAGGSDGGVWVFDAAGARRVGGHRGACMSVALALDGKLCASGGRDGTARVFELGPEARERLVLEVDDKPIVSVALTEDGGKLACVSRRGLLRLFDAQTGELLNEIPAPRKGAASATIDRKAQLMAWIGDGGTIRTWDVRTGARVHPLRDRDLRRVSSIALAEEGLRLACATNDYFAHVYDLETGERLALLNDPEHSIWSLTLDAAGETLATGARDGTISVWDVDSGERLLKLRGSFEAVLSLEFRRDGRCLYAGTDNGAVEVWSTELE